MNPQSSKHSADSVRKSWLLTGATLLLLGIALIATITLSAVGILLAVIGLGTIVAAYIRAEKNVPR